MKKNIIKDERHEFEIVESFPDGAFVWNIGRQNFKHECYLPIAFLDMSFSDLCHVDVERLKAIKVESEEIAIYIAEVAHRETADKKELEENLEKVGVVALLNIVDGVVSSVLSPIAVYNSISYSYGKDIGLMSVSDIMSQLMGENK